MLPGSNNQVVPRLATTHPKPWLVIVLRCTRVSINTFTVTLHLQRRLWQFKDHRLGWGCWLFSSPSLCPAGPIDRNWLAGSMESRIVSQAALTWPEPVNLAANIQQLRENFDPYSWKSPIRGESSTPEPMTVVICDINFWTKILHLHRQRRPLYHYAYIFHSVYSFLTLWITLVGTTAAT